MKTRILLTVLGAAAFAAITANVSASDALLSPRAQGNVIKHIAVVANDPNLLAASQSTSLTPRAFANRIVTVAGSNNGANSAITCNKMAGSPKMIAECASHPGAAMPCCLVADAK